MAMTTCRECGLNVSTEAASCPHCGVPTPGVVARGQDSDPRLECVGDGPAKRRRPLIIAGVGVLVLLLLGVITAQSLAPPSAPRSEPTKYERYVEVARAAGADESTSEGEADEVAANLCDNDEEDFGTLFLFLQGMDDPEAVLADKLAMIEVYCPDQRAVLERFVEELDQ